MPPSQLTARLSDAQSTAVFRSMLDAMCRPGVPRPATPIITAIDFSIPRQLLPVLSLADLDLKVHVVAAEVQFSDHGHVGSDPLRWAEMITRATGATHTTSVADADWVVALHQVPSDLLSDIRTGTAAHPEHGTWLVIGCDGFERGVRVLANGPGTEGTETFFVPPTTARSLEKVALRNLHPPAGVDTFLVDPAGSILALPRSVNLQVLAEVSGSDSVTS
jgi:phosphonate C-P lyase system protein PhnH